MMQVVLPGSIRSKKNSKRAMIVGGVNKPKRAVLLSSKAYLKWENEARWEARIQLRFTEMLQGPIAIRALFYYKGPRPDLQGAMESLADCLEGICYLDDKQIVSWDGSRLIHDKSNPRTVVEITELGADQKKEGAR